MESTSSEGTGRHLSAGITSTALSTALSALSSLVRIPLTISAVGVAAYGVIATLCSLFGWVAFLSAGARIAASGVATLPGDAEVDSSEQAHRVTRATWRLALPTAVVLIFLVLALPWRSLADPGSSLTHWELAFALVMTIAIGLASVRGAALLGIDTTRGSFKAQNRAVVAGVLFATVATAIAALVEAPVVVFAIIWVASLATPSLPATVGAWWSRERSRRREPIAPEIRSMSTSGTWIALGQQVAAGFDLVIVTVFLGSAAAAEYGLVTRLAWIAVTPSIGAAPALTRAAGEARRSGSGHEQARCIRMFSTLMGIQLVVAAAFLGLAGWTCGVLSSGTIRPGAELILAASAWVVLEPLRRSLTAVTSTSAGLRSWRTANLVYALPNVALSILLTRGHGVSGPLAATLICLIVMLLTTTRGLRLTKLLGGTRS